MRFNWNPDFGSLLPTKSDVADILRKISGSDSGLTMMANALDPQSQTGSALGAAMPNMGLPDATRGAPVPYGAIQDAPTDPVSLFQYLMSQAQGSQSKAGLRAATAPQRAVIHALQNQLGQVGAQTAQNQADIDSWYGQLGGMYSHNAKVDKRASKKAAKGAAKLGRGLMKGIADPNVARGVAAHGMRDVNYIQGTGAEQAAFDRHQAVDAAREGDYYKMVQARLGAQAQADIRTQLAGAQAARVAARQEAQSGGFDNMLKVLGLVGDNPTLDSILGVGGGKDSFGTTEGSALQSALDNVGAFKSEDQGGAPTSDFNGILSRMYAAAKSRGLDINDPAVQDAIRNYVQANVVGQYNDYAGTNYGLRGNNFGGG